MSESAKRRAARQEAGLAELREAGARAAAEAPPMSAQTKADLLALARKHRRERDEAAINRRVGELLAVAPRWSDDQRVRVAGLLWSSTQVAPPPQQEGDPMKSPQLCGRPTKAGHSCRQPVRDRGRLACGTHETDQDRAVTHAYLTGYQEGLAAERASQERADRSAERAHRDEVQRLRQEVQDAKDAAGLIRHTDRGAQVVQVGKYAYRWTGSPPLAVGDAVIVPSNWLFSSGTAEVTALGTEYRGELASITRRARPDELDSKQKVELSNA